MEKLSTSLPAGFSTEWTGIAFQEKAAGNVAILIVEFAKQAEERGATAIEAAVEAARTRLRPIVMTSLAFILRTIPLVFATGPGAELRQALGTAVFFGMIGVTAFGLPFTPLFYTVCRSLGNRLRRRTGLSPASAGRVGRRAVQQG